MKTLVMRNMSGGDLKIRLNPAKWDEWEIKAAEKYTFADQELAIVPSSLVTTDKGEVLLDQRPIIICIEPGWFVIDPEDGQWILKIKNGG